MRLFARRPNRGDTERLGGRNERESCRALRLPDPSGGRGRDNRAAVHRSHRSRAIRGLLMAHLYKRAANHWKRPTRFERRESEQEEEEEAPLLEGHHQGQDQEEGTLEVSSSPRRTTWPLPRSRTRKKGIHR